MDTVSYLLGKKAGGGSPTPISLQDKEVEITENGETTVTADSGYNGLRKVDITTNVPQPSGKINITQNGTNIDISSYATADVAVPSTPTKYKPNYLTFGGTNNRNITSLLYETQNVDTSNIVDMGGMFSACWAIPSNGLDVSEWDTSKVKNMYQMFATCRALTTLDLSNFDTSSVGLNIGTSASMGYANMFDGSYSITSLNLSSFTNENTANCYGMFNQCTSLMHLDMRKFDFTTMKNYTNMFGSTNSTYVPASCEIIVKDATQKQWLNTNISRLTNVKTVAEYEGS